MRHDTRFDKLDTLEDYELQDTSQDIRGRPLVDAQGRKFGIIEDLLVNEGHDCVTAVRLDNGKVCAVEPLEIHDNVVVYGEKAKAHAQTGGDATREEVIPVVEEQVVIGKRVDEDGKRISVRSRVVTDTVGEDVQLRKEQIDVDKRAVNRDLSSEDADQLFQGETVTMTERNEEAVVGKKAVVTDEVVISKTAKDTVEHVEENVRRTEVDVDVDGKSRDNRR